MTSLFQQLGIHSERDAAELERDLGVRFGDFTTDDCETWIRQTVYLEQFSRTRLITLAADDADVSVRTARRWQTDNTLGFNQRLEIAVLRYTDMLEVMLLQRAQAPDSPTSLLMMLARAQMPEKYGPARRGGPPRDNGGCDHQCHRDSQPAAASRYDKDFLDDVRRDLQDLKQSFAGLSEPDLMSVQPGPNPSPGEHETPTHPDPSPVDPTSVGAGSRPAHDLSAAGDEDSDLSPVDQTSVGAGFRPAHDLSAGDEDSDLSPADPTSVGAGFKPAHDLSTGDEDSDLSPADPTSVGAGFKPALTPHRPEPAVQNLTRSQRRQLQRKQRKHQNSRRARAPT